MAKHKRRIRRVMERVTKDQAAGEFELAIPVMDGGEKIDVLYFKKPSVRDLKDIEEASRTGRTEADQMVVSVLTGTLTEAVDRIAAEDFEDIKEALPGFLSEKEIRAIENAMMTALAASLISLDMDSLATGGNG